MENKAKDAIELLHLLCGNSGCVISDSGGKDSSVLKHIAMLAKERYNMPFSVQHNHTTVDAPETVYFIRREKEKHRAAGIEYNIIYPRRTMWQLIVDHATPPTRLMRYCCTDFCELAWTSFKTAVRKYKYTWQGMIQENMKNKEYRIHPTQKPVALYEWILTTFAAAGDVVLDTHVGSASSLIACRNTGHKFVGFELSEHYFNLSQERYRQETAQMRLSDFMGGSHEITGFC